MNHRDGNPEDTGGSVESYFDIFEDTSDDGGSITPMDSLPSYEIAEGLFFRAVFAEHMSFNFVTFPPGSGFPSHAHLEEQVSIVREGEMEFTIGSVTQLVRPGDVIVIPPNVRHSGRTLEKGCRLIDTFSPPRTGIRDVIATANPVRAADVDRWWHNEDELEN